jgi:hypothetical protein
MQFCSKTNQIHDISNIFYFGTTLYVFRRVSPSIIRSLRLYAQHQVYVIQGCLLAGMLSSTQQSLFDMYLMVGGETVRNMQSVVTK